MTTKGKARRGERGQRRRPRLTGRALRIDAASVPLWSGAVHYWRLAREDWRPALESVRGLGLSLVETYAPWGVHEVAPGEFDFGERDPRKDLGAFLDLAAEVGHRVIFRPGPHINAELTYFGLPERVVFDRACQARSPRQAPVILSFPPRMFPVPSYASTTYLAETGRWFDAVGAVVRDRIWPDGPIVLLQVDNEAAYYFRDDTYDQDYHPDAVELWRRFLEARHGGLEAAAAAHRRRYVSWDEALPPQRFDATGPETLAIHLDWAQFKEELITQALRRFKRRMSRAGMRGTPTTHNLPPGDGGLPVSVPSIDRVVDLVGLDYYHASRQHRTIKRRTLYLAGTVAFPYAPELGVGAPYWFYPLGHEDSLFTALVALGYGLRGFNLYMAVDRDRWYGAPIDSRGTPRIEAAVWRRLVEALRATEFHALERRAEVGLMVPREYGRLTRATHLLGGLLSASHLEAIGGSPVDACLDDPLGFAEPIQVRWWSWLGRISDALTEAGIPYVYVDGESEASRLAGLRLVFTPSYEFVAAERWRRLADLARQGVRVVHGPFMPTLDDRMRRQPFEVPRDGRRVAVDAPEDALALVEELATALDLARPFPVTPRPVETMVHERDGSPVVLFVVQPDDRGVVAEVALPRPMELEDALTGERIAGADRATIPLDAKSCRMFLLRDAPAARPARGARRRAASGAA